MPTSDGETGVECGHSTPRREVAMKINKVGHIGIAVEDLDSVAKIFEELFGIELAAKHEAPAQPVKVAMLNTEGAILELVTPTDEESGLAKFVKERGNSIHHISFEVEDIDAALEHLKQKGVELIDKEPRVGAEGKRIAFIHPNSCGGILIELKEKA
jgi:methylmalonyl-CoA/ethylmalonyl-CoA epimerase